MINFFRKTRKRLADDNKPMKYIRYAIGEILLVVIGILIALQVNNWNEARKFKNEGFRIQQELFQEFEDNRLVLKERINLIEDANIHVRKILSYVNSDEGNSRQVNIDSILIRSVKYGNYNPANSTILELIGSGKLNIIQNVSLKKNLYKWLQLLKDSDEDFKNQDMQAQTYIAPYFYKHISIKNLNIYNRIGISEESELFNKDYSYIFQDLEFENLYQDKLFWNTIMINHYKELDDLAIEIINQTKVKISDN